MSTIITTAEAIPIAAYYVLSDDAFMSNWGLAEGRVNTIILPCSNRPGRRPVRGRTTERPRDAQPRPDYARRACQGELAGGRRGPARGVTNGVGARPGPTPGYADRASLVFRRASQPVGLAEQLAD